MSQKFICNECDKELDAQNFFSLLAVQKVVDSFIPWKKTVQQSRQMMKGEFHFCKECCEKLFPKQVLKP